MKIKQSISICLGVLTTAFVMLSSNLFSQQVLKPQEAFPIEIFIQNDVIQINHRIEDGYYLYKDKISYKSIQEDIVLTDYTLPEGIQYEDEFFGKTEIYRAPFTVYVTLKEGSRSLPLKLEVNSQGCADIGLCYPPQSWIIDVRTGSNLEAAFFSDGISVSEEVRLGSMITESNLINVFFAFIGLGFLLAFTPCHLPTIPILSSIIIGQNESNKTKSFALSITYVLGMAITYSAFGTVTALAGNQMQALFAMPSFILFMAILFIILGLSMLGLFNMQMPSALMNRANNLMNNQKGGSYVGVFIIGILSAFLVTACVAPPLVATLMVIGQSGDIFRGIIALTALSIGLGIPLMVIGLTASKWLPTSGKYLEAIKELFGFIMIGLAVWIMNPFLNENYVSQIYLLLASIAIIYFVKYLSGSKSIKNLVQTSIAAITILVITFNILNNHANEKTDQLTDEFYSVENSEELRIKLEEALNNGKPSMVYFTADWCVSCRRLERNTFSDQSLQAKIVNIQALKVDLTDNSSEDQLLIKNYAIFGPPTIIFFDSEGKEQKNRRIIGVVNADILKEEIDSLENKI
tara:strand:+ start:37 stop:1767 length:1731 start_codon:yes stop_codon:yes gene_type:complete